MKRLLSLLIAVLLICAATFTSAAYTSPMADYSPNGSSAFAHANDITTAGFDAELKVEGRIDANRYVVKYYWSLSDEMKAAGRGVWSVKFLTQFDSSVLAHDELQGSPNCVSGVIWGQPAQSGAEPDFTSVGYLTNPHTFYAESGNLYAENVSEGLMYTLVLDITNANDSAYSVDVSFDPEDIIGLAPEPGAKLHDTVVIKTNIVYDLEQPSSHVHNYVSLETLPGCTTQGYTTLTCSSCHNSYKTDYTEVLNHDFGEWLVRIAPTCTSGGLEYRVCSRCDNEETRDTQPLGVSHSYGEWTVRTPATCTSVGVEYQVCSVCALEQTREIAIVAHSYAEYAVTAPATCTQEGTLLLQCSVCNAQKTETIQALGHSYLSAWTIDSRATSTRNGTKSHHCARCDAKTSSRAVIYGDADGSGIITSSDITRLTNYIAIGIDSGLNYENSDMNLDGIISGDDLSILVRLICV